MNRIEMEIFTGKDGKSVPLGSSKPAPIQVLQEETMLKAIRSQLIEFRAYRLDEGNMVEVVKLSHLIAAIAKGCFEQVRSYEPSLD